MCWIYRCSIMISIHKICNKKKCSKIYQRKPIPPNMFKAEKTIFKSMCLFSKIQEFKAKKVIWASKCIFPSFYSRSGIFRQDIDFPNAPWCFLVPFLLKTQNVKSEIWILATLFCCWQKCNQISMIIFQISILSNGHRPFVEELKKDKT